MTRLRTLFSTPGRKLIVYLTCGDPDLDTTVALVQAAAAAGADAVEIGVPFSDPTADGPVIQAAMQRALARGVRLEDTLAACARVRAAGCTVPLLLFGYYNPLFVTGLDQAARAAAAAGVDGLLVVDVPVDELAELLDAARPAGLDVVPLVAPTSTPARIARVAALEPPFVYYVSMTGVTGATLTGAADLAPRVAAVRAAVRAPVAVGFGVSTPDDARTVAQAADAVVVGSAIVRAIEQSPGHEVDAVIALVGALARAVHDVPPP